MSVNEVKPMSNTAVQTNMQNSLEKYSCQLNVFQAINDLIASDETIEHILSVSLDHVLKTLGYQAAQIYQLSMPGDSLWLYLQAGQMSQPVMQNVNIFSIDEPNLVSEAVRQGKPMYIPHNYESPSPSSGQNEVHGLTRRGVELAIPFKYGAQVVGVLWLQGSDVETFDEEDIKFMSSLAGLFGSTIRQNQKIQGLQDSLAEARTLYDLYYRDEAGLAPKYQQPISYQYDQNSVSPVNRLSKMASFVISETGRQSGIATAQEGNRRELIAPIQLNGETIGVLGIEDLIENEESWSVDDVSLLEEVSSQVALAIENARLLQQTQERTQELSTLFEATRQLTETIDLKEIYHILTNQIINCLRGDKCSVLLLDDSRSYFEVTIAKVRQQNGQILELTETRLEAIADCPSLQHLLKHPGIMMFHLDEPNLEQNTRTYMQRNKGQEIYTLVRFPVLVRSKLVAIMEVEHLRQRRNYTQNEMQLAQAIISQVTVAIENAQLFQQTQEALANTKKLYEISSALVESSSVEDIFSIVLENVKVYNVDRISISLLDRSKSGEIEAVTIVATWDRDPARMTPVGTRFSADNYSLVRAFAQPPFHPLISHDLGQAEDQDERMDEEFRVYVVKELHAVTVFSAPMFLGAEYKGVLSIYTRRPHLYTEQEIRVYQTLADQAIIAIENHRLLEATRSERDRASLLYELGQALSRTTTVDQIKNVILSFSQNVGASQAEVYITDGADFISFGSTIPVRQNLSSRKLAKAITTTGPELSALRRMTNIIQTRQEGQKQGWPLKDLPGMPDIRTLACIPFESQRSTLRGTLTFFQTEIEGFTEEHIATFESMAIQMATALENVWLLEQTNIVLKETELLYEATSRFNSALTVEDLLNVMVDSFAGTGVDFMSIALISGLTAGGMPVRLDSIAIWDQETQEIKSSGPTLGPNQYSFIQELRPNAHLEIYYRTLDATTQANIDQYLYGLRTILSIPLSVGQNWLGILLLGSKTETHEFKLGMINQMLNLADQAAIVIQNRQLVEETEKNLYYSEILSNLGQQLLTAGDKEAIYHLALSAIASTEPDRGVAIFMYDQLEVGVDLEMVANWDNPRQAWPTVPVGARFSTEELGLVPLLKTGLTLVSNEATEDERFSTTLKQMLTMMQVKVLVAIPLWLNQEAGGFILITRQIDSPFPAEMIRLYEDICRETSGALENRRLFDEAQYRARQLQTAAEVSQAATASLNLETLLAESVDLIKEQFGFYHVSIFLVDEYRRYAVVEASTGEIGQKMLAMRHKLEVGGRSIVGATTATGKPRIALDVGKDAVHFNNPLLPDTRSEMALPLIAQGRMIGALDVQSTKQSAFSKDDITILQSMANQLANAIEAARSLKENEKALEEIGRLHQHYMRDQWDAYIKERQVVTGYHLSDHDLSPQQADKKSTHPEVNQVIIQKRPVLVPGLSANRLDKIEQDHIAKNGKGNKDGLAPQPPMSPPAELEDQALLIAPLTLNGQAVIGTVDFEIPGQDVGTVWDDDILRIIEAVTSQAAQAIEAARLFEQTRISHEEAEALYEVGRILVEAEKEQEIFDTVLAKMLSTLGLKQGGILLFEDDQQFGKLHALFEDGKPVANPDLRIPIKNNLSYHKLIESKRPVAIEDITTDPLVATVREINIARGIVSLLLVPIVINDEVVGAIGADSIGQKHVFTDREMNLAMAMADQLSITLQNRRLMEETRRRALLLQISSDVGRVATSILDEEAMMDEVVGLIKEQFGFYHVQIFLMDEASQFAVLHKSAGAVGQQLLAQKHKLAVGSQSVIGQVTDKRQPIVIRSTDSLDHNTARYRNELLPETQAELAVPLQVGETLIGALDIQSKFANAFTDEEISTLETLAAQLAVAIQNARAFREQQETAERLKGIDKLKTQFLANMSHELRTPLNSIIGFSRVILKGIDGPLTELQKTDLTSIHNSGQHLLGLINNILDLSKIEAGKMELNFEETEIEPIIKTVMATAVALVKDKAVRLQPEVPENLPMMWADSTRIRQVILNLVSNACKFTEEGSVTVRVKADHEKVVFSVIDTGIGIPENQLQSIFEEFTQVDASTTRKVGGTGLGLPISRHFVEMHQGEIWVESKPGHGSTFSFYIPLKPPAEEEVEPRYESSPDDKGRPDGKRLVIAIDDDPGVITLYKRYLEKQNYEVIGINHTHDIVKHIKAHAPFAILLDIIIPGKDGWQVLKELKEDPFTRDIPVIVCSIVSDKNRGFSLGATNYLIKPIVENELVEALRRVDNHQKEEVKVLVVDDKADDVLLIRRMLEAQSNYNISEASNGKEGLELVKTKEPDLIILDLNMPEMDGFEMIEVLKANEKMRAIPIIIVSAEELTSDQHERLTGQVEVLLHKGIFTENELLEDVSQALERLHQE
jgi:GAF domain-containing protein/CheY-like chemotaxis protein